MVKKYPWSEDDEIKPDEEDFRRIQSEAFAFTPTRKARMNLDLTEPERKGALPWILNILETSPNVHVLAEVLRSVVLQEPLWNVDSYQSFVSQMRFDAATSAERELETKQWGAFIGGTVRFTVAGYVVELRSDNKDVTIRGEPSFSAKISNTTGQSAVVQFGAGVVERWSRTVGEEIEKFKTTYGTDPQQLVMDIPDGIDVTLVRDARETMRPLKIESETGTTVEPELKFGDVLDPVTVRLQLLAKKRV